MKLLVSDYDDTIEISPLFKGTYIPRGTISNIRDLIHDGNKFMIATSRPYDSIMKEVKGYNIPYSFISTLNGCVVHDDKNKVVFSKGTCDLNVAELYKLYSCIENIEEIKDKDKVLYYIFRTKLLKNPEKLFDDLKNNGFDVQSRFLRTYNFVHPSSNKIDSIKAVQELLGIADNNIITVGESKADLEMIKAYYSYGVKHFLPNFEVLRNCNKKVKSLNDAFKYINKNI